MSAQTDSGWKVVGLLAVFGVLTLVPATAGWFESGGWLAWMNQPSPFWLVILITGFLMRTLSPSQLAAPFRDIVERLEALDDRAMAQQELLEAIREDLGVSPNQKSYRLLCRELLGDVPTYRDFCDQSSAWNTRPREGHNPAHTPTSEIPPFNDSGGS